MNLRVIQQIVTQFGPQVANHLWQSTVFAGIMALLTVAFRQARARVRFVLWLAASVKFFIPFALLIAVGGRLAAWRPMPDRETPISTVIAQFGQPFAAQPTALHVHAARQASVYGYLPGVLALVWALGSVAVLGMWMLRWRRVWAQVRRATPLTEGREADALRRIVPLSPAGRGIPLMLSADSMEPGVFGVLRPVLLWPQGISAHLDDAHLEAILAHEAGHIRRRDNLTAALHMLVEALFWFHPLVWWLGARLMAERERACDEAVLTCGNDASVYAESILKACKFCVESPLPCVAGVSGANLKRRIVRIMNQQMGTPLTFAGKFVLAAVTLATLAVPIGFGVLHAPRLAAQEPENTRVMLVSDFDSLSVKPSTSSDAQSRIEIQPGVLIQNNITLKALIAMAYGVQEYQVTGAPEWAGTDRFDVEAHWKGDPPLATVVRDSPAPAHVPGSVDMMVVKLPQPTSVQLDSPRPPQMQLHARMQALLSTQFGLQINRASQEMPVYDLTVSGSGLRLTPTAGQDVSVGAGQKIMIDVAVRSENGQVNFSMHHASADVLAHMLAQQLHRQVINKTGLTGEYDVDVHWPQGQDGSDAISNALEDQLGLKLSPDQAPVPVLVVKQVEKPAAN